MRRDIDTFAELSNIGTLFAFVLVLAWLLLGLGTYFFYNWKKIHASWDAAVEQGART